MRNKHLTSCSMMQLIVQLIGLARYDPKDSISAKAIVKLRELQQEFIQKEIVLQLILYISVFLNNLESGTL